ncbi:helix-turn-helix domain-containing protein [Robertmurraya korlensis]|uniref:helix-turn-helix domain-containing protein n=1 Tax=Robertmurraya korlensis TaxID=519977 RepID=UPI00203CE5D5|nr:helix-turn-helix transcriptional regulator [Robertmurraya korlensis]MCM3600547.1 helix-turn-helix domain-containing protein [Robertmurraya korlensis]
MIGKNIYQIRKRKGLSLSELAERAKISKSYLSNIERNLNQNPSINMIEKIASVLDVDMQVLLYSNTNGDPRTTLEREWIDFVQQLKDSGIEKEQIEEYKTLIEFIQWKNEKNEDNNNR